MADKLTGYCMKCRRKDPQCEIVDYEVVEMKNGSKAAKGTCAECGTGMYKMLSKEQAAALSGGMTGKAANDDSHGEDMKKAA